MKIPGKIIAKKLQEKLKNQAVLLKKKNIFPHLAVVLAGNETNSKIYVKQKVKIGKEIGAKVTIYRFSLSAKKEEIINLLKKLNKNPSIHGIIIQRPFPLSISQKILNRLILPQKDVDGFHPHSFFLPPIGNAVLKLLAWVHQRKGINQNFQKWLAKQKILIIGRGETAGKPIAKTLKKFGLSFSVASRQTKNLAKICQKSTIIVTCVGKPNIVRHDMIKPETILIGVGLFKEKNQLATDYNQEEIAKKAAFYTPTPGGVGPVNVTCLFENLLTAASKSLPGEN